MKDFPDSVILKDKAREQANIFRRLAADATKGWQELKEMADDLGERMAGADDQGQRGCNPKQCRPAKRDEENARKAMAGQTPSRLKMG